MSKISPLVSIIIPTKNVASQLPRLVKSIKRQIQSRIEIIVVDNNSSDETKIISRNLGVRFYNKGPERGAQKNYGAKMAKGEFIFFLDADMELDKTVIKDCFNSMTKFDAIMVPEHSIGDGFWNKCVILERDCYIGDDDMEAARFFRKSIFDKLKGFDENLVASGDDLDLSQRAKRQGYKLGRITSNILHYEGSRNPWSTVKKWRYYGRDMAKYYAKNPKEAMLQYLPLRRSWIRNWRKLITHPILTSGFIFLKICNFIGVMWGQLDTLTDPKLLEKNNPYQK